MKQSRVLVFLAALCCSLNVFAAGGSQPDADQLGPVDFVLPDVDGRPLRLSEFRGSWVVVNFWATWCGPCIKEMPDLQAFHDGNPDGAKVLGVNFEEISVTDLKAFLREHRIRFPIVRIGETPIVPFEPLLGVPSTFVVTPAGEIGRKFIGPVTSEQLQEAIDQLKAQAVATGPAGDATAANGGGTAHP